MSSKNATLFLLVIALGTGTLVAQLPGPEATGTLNVAFLKLFGTNTTFQAKVEAQVLDKAGREYALVPLTLEALDGKARADIDISRIKSKDLPEFAVNAFKQAGMDRITSLILPEKQGTYMVYPGVQSYFRMPLEAADAQSLRTRYTIQKTMLGNETVEGHACIRHKAVVNGPEGNSLIATTWNATDLRNFPVQIQTADKQNSIILRFKQIEFTRPDAKKFELPPQYTEYATARAMMFSIMKKIAGGATEADSR